MTHSDLDKLHKELGINPVTLRFLTDFYRVVELGPLDRIIEGGRLHDVASAGIAALRGDAIEELHRSGLSYTQIGDRAGGVHRSRIAIIARGYKDQLKWLGEHGVLKPSKR